MVKRIVIIGAGLSGLACALYLARRNTEISIFEYRSLDELYSKDSAGRAMSMDLSARGMYALKELGILERVIKDAVAMRHKIYHGVDGSLCYIPYGSHEEEYVSTVSRNNLYLSLIGACEQKENIKFFFCHKLVNVDFSRSSVQILDKNNNMLSIKSFDIAIGADGSNSSMRQAFEKYTGSIFTTTILRQGYKELSIPYSYAVQKLAFNAMHLWSRDEFMLVAQPNLSGSFTAALLLPLDEHPLSFSHIASDKALCKLFQQYFPDLLPLMPDLFQEYREHPVGRLRILQGTRYTCNGNALLIGDCAHGMVPFFGQGVNCCFEDCTVLNQCLDEAHDQWPIALTLFNDRRVENSNAITTMSFDNYPELHQANIFPKVLLKKQIDAFLSEKYSPIYVGYHRLVCFHRVPYSYALACKKLQEPLLDRLSEGIETVLELNMTRVDAELDQYRQKLVSLVGGSNAH